MQAHFSYCKIVSGQIEYAHFCSASKIFKTCATRENMRAKVGAPQVTLSPLYCQVYLPYPVSPAASRGWGRGRPHPLAGPEQRRPWQSAAMLSASFADMLGLPPPGRLPMSRRMTWSGQRLTGRTRPRVQPWGGRSSRLCGPPIGSTRRAATAETHRRRPSHTTTVDPSHALITPVPRLMGTRQQTLLWGRPEVRHTPPHTHIGW